MKFHHLVALSSGAFLTLVGCSKEDEKGSRNDQREAIKQPSIVQKSGSDVKGTDRPKAAPVVGLENKKQFLEALEADGLAKLGQLQAKVGAMAASEPVETINLVIGLPPGIKRDKLLTSVAKNLPSNYAPQFLEAVEASGYVEDFGALAFFFGRGQDLPSMKDTEDLLRRATSDHSKVILFRALGDSYAQSGGLESGGGKFWDGRYTDAENQRVNNAALDSLASKNPSVAASVLGRNWDAYSRETTSSVLGGLGLSQAKKIAPEVLALSKDRGYQNTVQPFLDGWLAADSIAASKWVSGLSEGQIKDRAIAQLARYAESRGDRETANGWIKQIKDQSVLEEAR